jgi:hypothetical protein
MMTAMLFAARLGRSGLIVRDRPDYLALLTALLATPGAAARRRRLRARLAAGVLRAPLFDVARWVADFDALARTLWDAHLAARPAAARIPHVIPVRPRDLL